jgi:fimbrial chaperone protein
MTNGRERECPFEVLVRAWGQNDGTDVLSETRDIVATPNTFIVPAGRGQIIRFALPTAKARASEQTYRVIVNELPAGASEFAGEPTVRLAGGWLIITNDANAHVQFRGATFENGEVVADLPRYLLAGQSITRPAPALAKSLQLTYVAASTAHPTTRTIALEAAGRDLR